MIVILSPIIRPYTRLLIAPHRPPMMGPPNTAPMQVPIASSHNGSFNADANIFPRKLIPIQTGIKTMVAAFHFVANIFFIISTYLSVVLLFILTNASSAVRISFFSPCDAIFSPSV